MRTKKTRRGRYDRSLSAKDRRSLQHDQLLQAAASCFAEQGYAGSTVEHIVARAGISRRTFYQHFDDLQDALLQVHKSLAGQAFALLELALGTVDDPLEQLRVGVQTFFGLVATNGPLARVIFREVRLAGPDFEARWEQETSRYVKLLQRALAQAHHAGQLSHPPDEALVFALITGAEAVAMRHVHRGEEAALLKLAPRVAELFLRAFR